jgi:hypothetical protein
VQHRVGGVFFRGAGFQYRGFGDTNPFRRSQRATELLFEFGDFRTGFSFDFCGAFTPRLNKSLRHAGDFGLPVLVDGSEFEA